MKPKSKKALIILFGLAAAGTGVYFLFKDDNSPLGEFIRKMTGKSYLAEYSADTEEDFMSNPVSDTKPMQTSVGCSGYGAESFPLKRCMKGTMTKNVQTILNELYTSKIGAKLVVDGYFGENTEKALISATGKSSLSKSDYNSLASAATAKENIDDESFFGTAYDSFTSLFD